MKEQILVDTNIFLNHLDYLKSNEENFTFIVSTIVLEELENQKISKNKDLAFKARNAVRYIENEKSIILFQHTKNFFYREYKERFDNINNMNEVNDLKIIYIAKYNNKRIMTSDLLMNLRASSEGVDCILIKQEDFENNVYKGYRYYNIDEDNSNILADLYNQTLEYEDYKKYNFIENEYIIAKNAKTDKTINCFRYSNGKVRKIIPYYDNLGIKFKNAEQACAMDLLFDDNIPIKIIVGGFGSGKTFLSTKIGLHKVIKLNKYKHLMMLRNPTIDGEEIGFLAGTKEDKTRAFFKPLEQHISRDSSSIEKLEMEGKIQKEIIGYIKGLSIPNTFIIVDEAEDLTLKQLKMCGSRIEETSSICFIGDYNQVNHKYAKKSGLLDLIDKTKNSPYVGVVLLDEDLRSPASKVFANI